MDHEEGILSVGLTGGNRFCIHTASSSREEPFEPWLLVESPDECERGDMGGVVSITGLKGGGEFRHLVRFRSWSDFLTARDRLAGGRIAHFRFNNPVQQFLIATGKTLFRGMRYPDLHRLQLDIETMSLNPTDPEGRIILISLSDNRGFEEVIDGRELTESEMLIRLNRIIAERDPTVIEGHNLFDFDLAYISARATACNLRLSWGRDGSEVRFLQGGRRYRAGAKNPSYKSAYIFGRHLIDTYQQVQRFDIEGRLESYGLKKVVRSLGLERKGRTFVPGKDIGRIWRTDPQRLIAYALDDVRDVRVLSEAIVPTEFYQTQILPYSFQDAALSGPGEKINTLLIGIYLRRGLAIPRPRPSQDYPGGYTELREVGLFQKIVKADVESLYPSIMLTFKIRPASDTEDVFLPMLEKLTKSRLEAKARMKTAANVERAYWDGIQGSYKILINSFYGYLGYAHANFNDYNAARLVTEKGQEIILKAVHLLEDLHAKILEVDTDGAYFVVPPGVDGVEEEIRLVERVSSALPEGINLSHDGRFLGMISLKAKNYVLLDHGGRLIVKGSSLRSRRDERVFRDLIPQMAGLLIRGNYEEASRIYLDLAERIQAGSIEVEDFCRSESITEKTFTNPNLKRLAHAAEGKAIGQRVAVYQRSDGSLAPVDNYDHDEDRAYLLRRLHDTASRFRDLFTEEEFRRFFPAVRAQPKEQLSLF